jgi:MoxR-like ATPase
MPKKSSLKILEPSVPPAASGLGDRIRNLTQKLRQEDEIQVKATVKILGAAAQMAQNYDRLVDEVVKVVEADLQHQPPITYTEKQLRQQFTNLKAAKSHFNIKASSWSVLVEKLNTQARQPSNLTEDASLELRVKNLELGIQRIQVQMTDMLALINQLIEK